MSNLFIQDLKAIGEFINLITLDVEHKRETKYDGVPALVVDPTIKVTGLLDLLIMILTEIISVECHHMFM